MSVQGWCEMSAPTYSQIIIHLKRASIQPRACAAQLYFWPTVLPTALSRIVYRVHVTNHGFHYPRQRYRTRSRSARDLSARFTPRSVTVSSI